MKDKDGLEYCVDEKSGIKIVQLTYEHLSHSHPDPPKKLTLEEIEENKKFNELNSKQQAINIRAMQKGLNVLWEKWEKDKLLEEPDNDGE